MPSHINVSDFSLTKICRNTSLSKEKSLNESSQRKATHNAQLKDKLSALTYICVRLCVCVCVSESTLWTETPLFKMPRSNPKVPYLDY